MKVIGKREAGGSCFAFAFWDARVIVQQEAYILVQFNNMSKALGEMAGAIYATCHFSKNSEKGVDKEAVR